MLRSAGSPWLLCVTFLLALSIGAIAQIKTPAASAREPVAGSAEPAASTMAFDVASIHLSPPSPDGHHHIWNDVHNSEFRTGNLSTRDLIQYAYNIPDSQIVGGPEWINSAMYDIDAKADPAVDALLKAMATLEATQKKREMVQALLAERFAFTMHNETRELPVYDLVLAKGGPKFQLNNKVGNTDNTGRDHLHVSGMTNTVPFLARDLAQLLGRVVVDKTGLPGSYDLTLRWTPDNSPLPLHNGAPDPNAPPGLFTAIQEQLGLKLVSTKGPVPILVIDHIEKPTPN